MKYIYIKRGLDLLFALVLIVLTFPIMLTAALFMKLADWKGPLLFIQERPGKDGVVFKIYKFRTMIVQTEINGRKLTDGERLTSIGRLMRKTSIDELPQLINIVKGEMSFIGPRPLLLRYVPYYTKEEMKRHSVLPGITGLAQVSGRNLLTWEEKFEKDIEYVENLSFLLDLKIFLATIHQTLLQKNIIVEEDTVLADLDEIRKLKDS